MGAFLSVCDGAVQWWIGDWINYGEHTYGEKYAQALDADRWDYGTLRDTAWVASHIPMSRRHDKLSFAHHREVVPLEPDEQDALLEEAARRDWSRQELRAAVKAYKVALANPDGTPNPALPDPEPVAPGATTSAQTVRHDDADDGGGGGVVVGTLTGTDGEDTVAEWERAERELEQAQAELAALKADDTVKALAEERDRRVRIEGRLQLEMATRAQAEKDIKYAKGLLAEIRQVLSVETNREVLPAIKVLLLR